MGTTTATIKLSDDGSPSQPIASVVVQVFTTLGILVTSGTTDGAGSASFLLPDGTYNILFYKQGVSILPQQPQQIVVDSTLISNTFLVTGHVATLPESPDPLRCRVSGTLLGPDGLPVQDLRISFRPIPDFSVVGGSVVSMQSQVVVSADPDGYFQFDLLQGLQYQACPITVDKFPLLGIDPLLLLVLPPQVPSISLANLLFPLPVEVQFSVASISIPLADGANTDVVGTISYSDGSVLGTGQSNRSQQPPFASLTYAYSDPTLFSMVLAADSTQITPYKTGTGTVTFTRTIPSSIFWPNPPAFVSQTLTVTIT